MAVLMPLARLLHRLLRTSTCGQPRLRSSDVLRECRRGARTLSTFPVRRSESQGDGSDPSPREGLRRLLPRDALFPDVSQLRDPEEGASVAASDAHGEDAHVATREEGDRPPDASVSAALPGESSLAFGELLVAEHKKRRVEFRKMFELREGASLQSNWGAVAHDDVAGRPAGCFLKSSRGVSFLVRRASLEDYVLYMKRGPAITYPKDASAMLMMMDITVGDRVLESGSGSGAMTLFLSRAVGFKGSVLSVEVRKDHHTRAVHNYKRWRQSWSVQRGEEWPDNVQFHLCDLSEASALLGNQGLHAVALDLIHPQLVLPTVVPHLYPGAVCAVYLANITQVVDLLEGIRCLRLPLLCERIVEVQLRDWVVAAAFQKDGSHCVRKSPVLDQREEASDGEETSTDGHPAFGSIPYIARPHPEQMSHTAFLVKLRKYVQ